MLAMTALAPVACRPAQGGSAVAAESGSASQEVATRPSDRTDEPARPEPGTAWVVFGTDTVVAEVARSADERAEGLMYRDEVPDGTGMLFVFTDSKVRSFWMQNTYVPLDIAYMDASFTVVDIQQMEAQTTDPHESAAPAMFALEVRRGWLEEHGIGVGDRASVEFGLQMGG
jgi:uncharacterized membrane protein (UPF0127 family)